MNVNVKQLLVQCVGLWVALCVTLFLPAGTLAWQAGWIFLALFFSFYLAVMLWLLRHNPGLLQERLRLGTIDQQGWDKLLFPLVLLLFFAWLAFTALDVAASTGRRYQAGCGSWARWSWEARSGCCS